MKKAYTLSTATDNGAVEYGSKKTAIKYGEASGESFTVYSPSGQVVHEYTRPEPEAPTPKARKTPEPTTEETSLKYTVSRTLPGNYSIVMAPFVVELASLFDGVVTHTVTFPDKLERRVDLSSNSKATLDAATRFIDEAHDEARQALREWQKDNIERRRTLTDMERYIEHREYLANFGHEVAELERSKK